MLFAYYHDDDEFSKEEQKAFKKLLKKDHDYLSSEDVKEVLDTIQDAKSVGDLHVFITNHQYTKDIIQNAVTTVKKYANYQQRYLSIITQVIDSYQP